MMNDEQVRLVRNVCPPFLHFLDWEILASEGGLSEQTFSVKQHFQRP